MRLTGKLYLLWFLVLSGLSGRLSSEQSATPGTEVTVSLRVHGPSGQAVALKAQGSAKWFGKEKFEPVAFNAETGTPSTLKLRSGRWTFVADSPSYWGAPYQLELGDKPAAITLDLWPAGTIEGGFISDQKLKSPTELAAFFRSAPGIDKSQAPPSSKAACSVESEMWRCKVPAGVLDLRFQAAGFVPRYLWGVRVEQGRTARPGRLDLHQGSAVQGWIVTVDGNPVGDQAKVSLRPRISGSVYNPAERKRLESLHFEGSVNPRGFFQIEGVPPGAYLLEAHHQRYAPAIVSVRVLPGEVTDLANPPVMLDFPKSVEIFIDPPLDPVSQPWSVKLQKHDKDSHVVDTIAEERAGGDGAWKKQGVAPGDYIIRVSRQGGETWWDGEMKVDENPAPLYIRMDLVTVRGTVHYGKEPLPAKLQFGGKWGATRIEAQSNSKGSFEAVLPRAGNWTVYITSEQPAIEREIRNLKIEPHPGTKVAEIELSLPNTVLRGRVVDEENNPLPKAIVSAETNGNAREAPIQVFADEEGHFEIRGLLPGPTLAEADAGEDLHADPVSIDVQGEEDSKSWILVARKRLRISGSVASAAGPVAGAQIKAVPAGRPFIMAPLVTSDAQGHFDLRLPPKTQEILVSVSAPGFAFRMLRVSIPENHSFGVNLDQTGGTVVLQGGGDLDPADPKAPAVYLLHGGAFEPLPLLEGWAIAAGGSTGDPERTAIPSLEPGPYQACLVFRSERPGLDFGIVPRDRCVSGTLAANGELVLKLPSHEANSSR